MTTLREQVLRGGAYLALRQGMGTVVSLVGAVLLVRALGPGPYGLYAAAAGFFAYLQTLGRWGIDVYLVRRPHGEAADPSHDAFTFLVLSGTVVGSLAAAAAGPLAVLTRLDGLAPVARALFAALPLSLAALVPLARLERALDYRRVALVELAGQVLYYGAALPLAWSGAGVWAPVVGWWVQQAVLAGSLFALARYRPRPRLGRAALREMLGYGLGYSASLWIWQLRALVNPVFVGRFAGAEAVGFVSLAIRLTEILSFVKSATYRLSVAVLARLQGERARLRAAVAQGMRLQILVLAPLLVGFAAAAPPFFGEVLGARWRPVSLVFPFIALATLVNATFNLHSSVLYVLRRNAAVARFHAAHLATFAGAAWLLVPRLGVLGYGWAEVAALWSYVVVDRSLHAEVGRPDYLLPAVWCLAAAVMLFHPWPGVLVALGVLLLPATRSEIRGLPALLGRVRGAG